jgi:hypothetical protein
VTPVILATQEIKIGDREIYSLVGGPAGQKVWVTPFHSMKDGHRGERLAFQLCGKCKWEDRDPG